MSKGKILFKENGMEKDSQKRLLKITGDVRTLHTENPDMNIELIDVHFSKEEYTAVKNMVKGLMEILAKATKRENEMILKKDMDDFKNLKK